MDKPTLPSDDFMDELAELALGSRLKRLSDRLATDAGAIYKAFDIPIQPRWFTLLALLHHHGPTTVVAAAQRLGLSQPAVSQFSQQIQSAGLLQITTTEADGRRRLLALTAKGQEQVKAMLPVWQAVQTAAVAISEEAQNNLYQAIQKAEQAIERQSLLQRTLDIYHEQHQSD